MFFLLFLYVIIYRLITESINEKVEIISVIKTDIKQILVVVLV